MRFVSFCKLTECKVFGKKTKPEFLLQKCYVYFYLHENHSYFIYPRDYTPMRNTLLVVKFAKDEFKSYNAILYSKIAFKISILIQYFSRAFFSYLIMELQISPF